MTDPDLRRYVEAQAPVAETVAAELGRGAKRSHWIWFIFPQLDGLGRSATARHYALRDLDQARRYLDDPVLGNRLRECVRLVLGHDDKSALQILGSPDDMKFRSCLTLFHEAAEDEADRALFLHALDLFYGGEPDPRTLSLLRREQ